MSIQWSCTSYDEDIARVVHQLAVEHGAAALTMRGIARSAGLSPGTLAYQFETKELLLSRCTRVIGGLLVEDLLRRSLHAEDDEPLLALVARTEDELADLKVWLDLVALGRTNNLVGGHVRDAEQRLRASFGRRLCDTDAARRVWLALQAVWADQLQPGQDLDPVAARATLRSLLPRALRS